MPQPKGTSFRWHQYNKVRHDADGAAIVAMRGPDRPGSFDVVRDWGVAEIVGVLNDAGEVVPEHGDKKPDVGKFVAIVMRSGAVDTADWIEGTPRDTVAEAAADLDVFDGWCRAK